MSDPTFDRLHDQHDNDDGLDEVDVLGPWDCTTCGNDPEDCLCGEPVEDDPYDRMIDARDD